MLAYSLETALLFAEADQLVVACHPAIRSHAEKLLEDSRREGDFAREVVFCQGGDSRAASVGYALGHVKGERVLIHDADRPLATPALFREVLKAVKPGVGVVPVVTPQDSVLQKDKSSDAVSYFSRGEVFFAQTPQAFVTEEYRMAREFVSARIASFNDDGSIFLAGGYSLTAVPGESTNIKVTFPLDIAIIEACLGELRNG